MNTRQQIDAELAADQAYREFMFAASVARLDNLYSGRNIMAAPQDVEEDERILDARLVQAAERAEVVRVARFKAQREDAPYRRSRWSRPDDDELESAAY